MRTLRRPMFRGGSTGTGITSGLDVPRQGYAHEPGHVVQDDWRKKKLRDVFGGDMTVGEAVIINALRLFPGSVLL